MPARKLREFISLRISSAVFRSSSDLGSVKSEFGRVSRV